MFGTFPGAESGAGGRSSARAAEASTAAAVIVAPSHPPHTAPLAPDPSRQYALESPHRAVKRWCPFMTASPAASRHRQGRRADVTAPEVTAATGAFRPHRVATLRCQEELLMYQNRPFKSRRLSRAIFTAPPAYIGHCVGLDAPHAGSCFARPGPALPVRQSQSRERSSAYTPPASTIITTSAATKPPCVPKPGYGTFWP